MSASAWTNHSSDVSRATPTADSAPVRANGAIGVVSCPPGSQRSSYRERGVGWRARGAVEQGVRVGLGESPLERPGDLLVAVLRAVPRLRCMELASADGDGRGSGFTRPE